MMCDTERKPVSPAPAPEAAQRRIFGPRPDGERGAQFPLQ